MVRLTTEDGTPIQGPCEEDGTPPKRSIESNQSKQGDG